MSIQDLGSIGELVAAIATVATLVYLAIQVRQNTRALRSSTFQEISNDMSVSSQTLSSSPDLSAIMVKGSETLSTLTAEESIRFSFFLLMTFRRLESTYVQRQSGFIGRELTAGFERSVISTIDSGGGAEWWNTAKPAFSSDFVEYVDKKLREDPAPRVHPGFGGTRPTDDLSSAAQTKDSK